MATIQVGNTEYRVERKDEGEVPYELFGPRGAHYGLVRNVPNPAVMFAVNLRRFGVVERLGWFTDKDGELRRAR